MSSRYMSPSECESLRERAEEGMSVSDLAEIGGWSNSTIRRHIQARCAHSGPGAREPDSREEIREEIREIADELGRIPSKTDWQHHGRSWSCDSLMDFAGGEEWPAVLELAGYPPIAPAATTALREAVYQNPELGEVRHE